MSGDILESEISSTSFLSNEDMKKIKLASKMGLFVRPLKNSGNRMLPATFPISPFTVSEPPDQDNIGIYVV